MRCLFAFAALAVLLAGCGHGSPGPSNAYAPSPHYGNAAACPGSATSVEGGNPTAIDCVPGGAE